MPHAVPDSMTAKTLEPATPAFVASANKLMDHVEEGCDSFARTQRDEDPPVLRIDAGDDEAVEMVVLELDPSGDAAVQLVSPFSGNLSYVPSQPGPDWVNTNDGHSLLGMVTRDLLRIGCRGLPKFAS